MKTTQAQSRNLRALAILVTATAIGLLPAAAAAYHRVPYHRHELARHYTPGPHFRPVIPLYAPYPLAPPSTVVYVEPDPAAGKLFAYPAQGQSQQQQSQDRYECHSWAASESGFDPITAASSPSAATVTVAPAPAPAAGPSDPITGAAGGAALGAIGGAIAGDPGTGAAVGAAVGGAVGLANHATYGANQRAASAQAAAQNAAALASQQTNYTRAMSTCLVARGYVVN